jgi:putative ABC transport system ATP-binding protein
MKSPLFSINEVSFKIAEKTILDNISLNIEYNKITGIIGPSGAGKSTFLRLLNKLISPTDGQIIYRDNDLKEISSQNLRKEIGMLQQQAFLFPRTVKDNLLYGPEIWNIDYSEEDLIQLLAKVALDSGYLKRDIEGLSGGEQQRVSLARSLANKPKVLLLDEPTSSLDISSEEIIEQTITKLNEEGIKIIIVSHSLEQTERITDILLFLRQGKLIEKSDTAEFFSNYDRNEIKSFFKKKEEK